MALARERSRSFRDLIVWQKARSLVRAAYLVTSGFPEHERFGLASQIQRAAVSVCANLAEGWGRGSRGELHRFVTIALGSLHELEALLDIAEDVGYVSAAKTSPVRTAVTESGRMLTGLRRVLAANRQGR